jgi:hypothetical protein
MAKKPKLVVIGPSATNPLAAPATLGKAGATLWDSLMSEYRIDDAGGREMLLQICSAADSAADYAAIIASDGAVIRTKGGLKEHPLAKTELATRSFIVRSLHRLGLDIEVSTRGVGRPPGSFTRTR